MIRPEHGLSTKVIYIDNYDGDTVTVKFERTFQVRLKDINCPELRDKGGKESRDNLKEFLAGKELTLFVPSGNDERLMDISSFTRIVGMLWANNENVQKHQVDTKHAIWVGGADHKKVVEADPTDG